MEYFVLLDINQFSFITGVLATKVLLQCLHIYLCFLSLKIALKFEISGILIFDEVCDHVKYYTIFYYHIIKRINMENRKWV